MNNHLPPPKNLPFPIFLIENCRIQLCIPAMHVTSLLGLIVPASYDDYTALVKSGNVASKHVWKPINVAYCWWIPGYCDLLSYVTFLLDMWPILCCFSFSTRELVQLRKRRDIFRTVL